MNIHNISVVFAPNFFRPKVLTMEDMINTKTMVEILKLIFIHKNEIFEIEETFFKPFD